MTEDVPSPGPDEPKRKRPRAARACQFCRSKKYRCDELQPCSRCRNLRLDCAYEGAEQPRPVAHVQRAKKDAGDNEAGEKVVGIREFHGQTSSVAFLAALDTDTDSNGAPLSQHALHNERFVSTFRNDGFSPLSTRATAEHDDLLQEERFHFKRSRLFLECHFQNIHFVHPILDKTVFMDRCEDLWFGVAHKQPRSFVALYYSIMSLGALVRTWDNGEVIDGRNRLQWSRKLFDLSCLALGPAKMNTDLDTIQTCFFLAKVCQNELNPSLAYLYLGLATRASFAAGINRRRRPQGGETTTTPDEDASAQRTWWSLYGLEVELSFALGRPDSLGPDQYHNIDFPPADNSETVIIPALVRLSRIIRRVCTDIYLAHDSIDLMLEKGLALEKNLDAWIAHLPDDFRPFLTNIEPSAKIRREPRSVKLQRIILGIRYHNVKMILLRPFLARATNKTRRLPPVLSSVINRCVDSARVTIWQLHNIYINQPFFRTWWNNITYILYAASTVLWYTINVAPNAEVHALLYLSDQAIQMLEAMDESVVAQKACETIKAFVAKAQRKFAADLNLVQADGTTSPLDFQAVEARNAVNEELDIAAMQDSDINLDFFDMTFPANETQSSFWTDYSSWLV